MLEVKHVKKEYRVGKGIFDINVTFEKGTITGVLGSNGSGKTTLLMSILGLLCIDEGEVLFDGKAVSDQYDRVALISEQGSYIAYMTPTQYGSFLKEYYDRFDMTYYHKLLEQFSIDLDYSIQGLSRGQQLKVELAAGLAMRADLLVLDEPFTTLDIYAKEDVVKLLIEQFHEDQIVLLTTHNIEEIEHIIDRCIVLKNGMVVEDIQLEALSEQGKDLRALLEQYRPEHKDITEATK